MGNSVSSRKVVHVLFVKEIFDIVYLVVDSCVLFICVQFLSSFDHSVMHWLNSGLNQKFWVTISVCRRSPASQVLVKEPKF